MCRLQCKSATKLHFIKIFCFQGAIPICSKVLLYSVKILLLCHVMYPKHAHEIGTIHRLLVAPEKGAVWSITKKGHKGPIGNLITLYFKLTPDKQLCNAINLLTPIHNVLL